MPSDLAAEIIAAARVAERVDDRNKEFCLMSGDEALVERLNLGWRVFEQRKQTRTAISTLKTLTRHIPDRRNPLTGTYCSSSNCFECKKGKALCPNQDCCLVIEKTEDTIVQVTDVFYVLWRLKESPSKP